MCAAKRSSPDDPAGLIVIDKPGGMTSHDVVSRVRRLARTRRVGHGGTLDPMATGVLVIGVGRATRLLTYVIGADKRYRATIRLGETTISDDADAGTCSFDGSGTLDVTRPGRVAWVITPSGLVCGMPIGTPK